MSHPPAKAMDERANKNITVNVRSLFIFIPPYCVPVYQPFPMASMVLGILTPVV
jgi:hypothetical protein